MLSKPGNPDALGHYLVDHTIDCRVPGFMSAPPGPIAEFDEGDKVLKPAVITVFYNGVLVQNYRASMGPWFTGRWPAAQPAEDSLILQNHNSAVRFRNIRVRRLTSDAP